MTYEELIAHTVEGLNEAAKECNNPKKIRLVVTGSDATFRFGKYIGQSVEEVFNKDLEYCKWLVREYSKQNDPHQEEIRVIRQLLLESHKNYNLV